MWTFSHSLPSRTERAQQHSGNLGPWVRKQHNKLLVEVKWGAVLPDKEARRGLLFTTWIQSLGKYTTFPWEGRTFLAPILPECPFLSRISAHRRPLVKWIAFHSALGLEVPSQPGIIITQTQSVSWHQVVSPGRLQHVPSGLRTSGIWKGQIDESEVRTKKVQNVPKFRLPDHTECFAIDIWNYFHLFNLWRRFTKNLHLQKKDEIPPKCPRYLNIQIFNLFFFMSNTVISSLKGLGKLNQDNWSNSIDLKYVCTKNYLSTPESLLKKPNSNTCFLISPGNVWQREPFLTAQYNRNFRAKGYVIKSSNSIY